MIYLQTGKLININRETLATHAAESIPNQHHVNMESSQFINQTRLSKKQLQLHLQQQNQKYFIDSPRDSDFPQQRCQYFAGTSPPVPHFPPPPPTESFSLPPSSQQQQQQQHCAFEQPSPSHRRSNIKKFHQSDPNSIEVCIDYENQHNNHVGGGIESVSDVRLHELLY